MGGYFLKRPTKCDCQGNPWEISGNRDKSGCSPWGLVEKLSSRVVSELCHRTSKKRSQACLGIRGGNVPTAGEGKEGGRMSAFCLVGLGKQPHTGGEDIKYKLQPEIPPGGN